VTPWRIGVDVDEIADLADDAALAAHGIDQLLPTRRQWPTTQPIGEESWRDGCRGLLAPSAAHVGGQVLVIFRPAEEMPGLIAVPPPNRYTELRVPRTADVAALPSPARLRRHPPP
jgi:RES domain-containing protein